jgi:hypothetical protein
MKQSRRARSGLLMPAFAEAYKIKLGIKKKIYSGLLGIKNE